MNGLRDNRGSAVGDQVRSPRDNDRSGSLTEALAERLRLDPAATALVTIDCHRGHLDPEVATMPVAPEAAANVVTRVARVCAACRRHGVPVVHVLLQTRVLSGGEAESMHNPFWREVEEARQSLAPGRPSTVKGHNLVGSVQTQLMPELGPEPGDVVIDTKRRLSAFRDTDLELILRDLGVDTVLLAGINTNTCVLCTAFEAFNRDLRVVVVGDAVASMYGDDLHEFGLQNVARCLGWVASADEVVAQLADSRIAGSQVAGSQVAGSHG